MKKVLTFVCAILLALIPALSACGFAEAAVDEARQAELQALCEEGKDYFFSSNGKTYDAEAAMRCFREAAEGGSAEAWFYMGQITRLGTDSDRYEKAMAYYQKAAELGSPLGLYGQGRLYQYGQGVEADPARAKELYEAAVAAGCAEANIGLSELSLEARDSEAAVKYAEKALEAKEPRLLTGILTEIAEVYSSGIGVWQDYEKSFEWMMKAAELGSSSACVNVGNRYLNGQGVEKDAKEAVVWYEKAAEMGNSTYLASCYYYGDGVAKNYKKAMELILQALDSNTAELNTGANAAYWYIATMYRDGLGVKADYNTSLEWYNKGIEAGDPDCAFAAAQQYMQGWGVAKDPEKAVALCEMGAEGSAYGCGELGDMYLRGSVVDQSYEKAISWYEKGAELGSLLCSVRLGDMYARGFGVETDFRKAAEYYEKGVELGYAICCARLGQLYGEWMNPPDEEKSAAWYEKGAEMGSAHCMVQIANRCQKGVGVAADPEKAAAYYYQAVEMAGKQGDSNSRKSALDALKSMKRTVEKMVINEKKVSVLAGASPELARAQLTCTISPETAMWKDVIWASSNADIATVDENGVVCGVAPGKVTITAASTQPGSKKTAKVNVTVGQAVTGIEIDKTEITLAVKKSARVKAAVSPKNATGKKLAWSSENEEIATVNANGQITGKSAGTTTITVKATEGSEVSASIVVTVE